MKDYSAEFIYKPPIESEMSLPLQAKYEVAKRLCNHTKTVYVMQPTNNKPLPDPSAFEGDKPRREDRIVRDEQGNERKPPDQKEVYRKAQEERKR